MASLVTDDRLYPAPRNSLGGPPPGIPHKGDGRAGDHRLVVVWLDWGRRVELVPATVEWVAGDRVLVQWHRGRTVRRSWLHRLDVLGSVRWERDRQVTVALEDGVLAAIDGLVARGVVGSRVEAVERLVAEALAARDP